MNYCSKSWPIFFSPLVPVGPPIPYSFVMNGNNNSASGRCPLDLLRPYLFHFSNRMKLNELHSRILQILRVSPEDHTLTIIVPACTEPFSDKVRRRFKESLTRHLFGYDTFLSLRMTLALADFTWVRMSTNDCRNDALTAQEAPLRHRGETYGVWPHCTRPSQCNLTPSTSYYH
jgi:hypothetical protein